MPPLAGKCHQRGESILNLESNQPRLQPREPENGASSDVRGLRSGLAYAVATRPKVITRQILGLPEEPSVDKNRRFPFELSYRVGDAKLGRDAQAHMHMVRQGMPFDQLQPKLLAQLTEDSANLLAQPSKDRLLSIFGDEHDVVPAIPTNVRLAFPFSHRLSSSKSRRTWGGEPAFCPSSNPGSVEPLRVTPPEAVV